MSISESDSRGIVDTCVLIDAAHGHVRISDFPGTSWITTVTLGELSAGPHSAQTPAHVASRQLVLQAAEAQYANALLPYDADAARIYGKVFADVKARGRSPRRRMADLLIASIAIARQLPLYTINVADYAGITDLEIVPVASTAPS